MSKPVADRMPLGYTQHFSAFATVLFSLGCTEPRHKIGAFNEKPDAIQSSEPTLPTPIEAGPGKDITPMQLPDAGRSVDPRVEAGVPDAALEGTCGNGVGDLGEACDDGNTIGGDGCDPLCQIEDGYVCGAADGESLAINGSFESITTFGFSSDYTLIADDGTMLTDGQCATRHDPAADPILHASFLLPANLPWRDVDPTGEERSLICNGQVDLVVWRQQFQLTLGRYQFGFWARAWGQTAQSALEPHLNGVALSAPVVATEGAWKRVLIPFEIAQEQEATLELINRIADISGNDFALDRLEVYRAAPDVCSRAQ